MNKNNFCNAEQSELLQQILNYEECNLRLSLLKEWLQHVQKSKCSIPEHLLPTLLNLGSRYQVSISPVLQAALCKQGKQFAKSNPRWEYIHTTTDPQDIWGTGSHDERQDYFIQQRKVDPAKALALLQTTWKQEKARAKRSFLQSLRIQLSIKDEDFLESCIHEQDEEVRYYASLLLGSLEDSQRFQIYIKLISQYITNNKEEGLQITLPKQYDEMWTGWGIDKDFEQTDIGERAGWLYQLLLYIRPSLFLAHLNLTFTDFSKKIRCSNFKELDGALEDAIMDHCDTQAAITIIEEKVTRNSFLHHLDIFSYILSSVQKEALLDKAIKKGIIYRWIDINRICNTFPEGLSHDLSEYLCTHTLPNLLENYKYINTIHVPLETLVLQLHPKSNKAFHRLGKLWEKAAESNQDINHFISIYQFRVVMYKAFN